MEGGENIPVAVLATTRALGTLRTLRKPTRPISRLLQLLRRRRHGTLLKRQHPRLSIIRSIRLLQRRNRTPKRMLLTPRILLRREPLRIISNTQVHFLRGKADLLVRMDRVKRPLHTAVVGRHVVATVHQIVRHDVDHVDGRPDLRSILLREGDHVASLAGDGQREDLVLADGLANGLHKERVSLDVALALLIRDSLVVVTVAAGVFPVDIYRMGLLALRSPAD